MTRKKIDPSIFKVPERIAVTGRIKSWLKDLETIYKKGSWVDKTFGFELDSLRRLPVSCTVYVVGDSMDELENSIEDSWKYVSHALRYGAGVAIHLSNLRPRDTDNGSGLVSSGPVSFGQIYSKLNEILRRGGTFRNGAVVLHLDADHPDIVEFATASRELLPWARRAINVDNNFINHPHLDTLLKSVESGDCFIVKKQFDDKGNRIYHNVCLEITLAHRGTCLLSHVNMGQVTEDNLVQTFVEGMEWLCKIHGNTGVELSGHYLSPKVDRQVGLGVLGLANFLAIEGIKYKELVESMEKVLAISKGLNVSLNKNNKSDRIASLLYMAFHDAAKVAKKYKLNRAFTVAPTANCSFSYKDREFYTTAPEIAPPVDISVERDSQTMGVLEVDYHPDCEIADEVGWDIYFRLNNAWQSYMDSTGLGHAISTNWWSDKIIMNKEFIKEWLSSSSKSLYYAWQVSPQVQNKSEILTPESMGLVQEESCSLESAYTSTCTSCAE